MAHALLACEAYDDHFQKRFSETKYRRPIAARPVLKSSLKRRSSELTLEYVRADRVSFEASTQYSEEMALLMEQLRNEQIQANVSTRTRSNNIELISKFNGLALSIAPGVFAMLITFVLAGMSFSKSVFSAGFFRPEVYYTVLAAFILLGLTAVPIAKTIRLLKK